MADTVGKQFWTLTTPFMEKYGNQWRGPVKDIQNQTMFSEAFIILANGAYMIHQEAGEHD